MNIRRAFLLFYIFLFLAGCENRSPAGLATDSSTPAPLSVAAPSPPQPPVFEDFEGEPQISLFPRLGDFRPEDAESERLPYWRTYIDHVSRLSGIIELPLPLTQHRVFQVRSIDGLDSVAFFAPLAVEPGTDYSLSAWLRAELPEGASAGIGFLEFDEFLWLSEQFPQSLAAQHQTGAHEGVRVSGSIERHFTVPFRSGPKTRMVHIVFFLENAGRSGLLIDDIRFQAARASGISR